MANLKENDRLPPGPTRGNVVVRAVASQSATIHPATTTETRLAAKAARGDHRDYSAQRLDDMGREERHKLLYGASGA